ncbi:DUF2141 domain-containing protein [Qipengyuania sp. DY56-A-20]|jgi:uncharacterized protein (DUF2141 family)|uniref:DUF2141 domain-containing protein n=1 Tax=Qipengyuania benthica TaxID=3067651 RepID=A0ABT9H4L0_9SPHN|nr:DUF2141 domain-containing protein [Qipengyuania sp. DY56-A-20]MBU1254756.1 DUF2141 domain-containing protein [Alphaproteobacteria bacterium]MBU1606225.1 DUF2141 domain-containing protein [Alphaproteobacteria bacterium]MDP4538261.1 DUF2141 domain-containing protein [Qipengyuania sp. DY56-A-20]
MNRTFIALGGTLAIALGATAGAAQAQYRQSIAHNPAQCAAGAGPAVMVTINGVSQSRGILRVQSYRATDQDWLQKGRWINRLEMPARAGTMRVCMPLPAAGHYGIAVRHDVNNNGKTDLSTDGGAMSNNPSINIWNLGKPSYKKVGFDVGSGVERISIDMLYR